MVVMQGELKNLVDDIAIKFERDFDLPRPTKDILQDPVRAQLSFYNEHDLPRFLSCFDTDVIVEDGDGDVMFSGHKQMYRVYNGVFEAKGLRAEVVNEMRAGEWVIHHQKVYGLPEEDEVGNQLLEQSSLDRPVIKQIQTAPVRPLKIRPQLRRDADVEEVVAAYLVRGGLIRKVVLLR